MLVQCMAEKPFARIKSAWKTKAEMLLAEGLGVSEADFSPFASQQSVSWVSKL